MGKCCMIILAVCVTLGHLASLALQAYVAATNVPLAFSVQNAQCKVHDRKLMTMSLHDAGVEQQHSVNVAQKSTHFGSLPALGDKMLSSIHSKLQDTNYALNSYTGEEDKNAKVKGVPLSCVVSNLEPSEVYKIGDSKEKEILKRKSLINRKGQREINTDKIKDVCETKLFVPKYAFVFMGFQKDTNIMCCNEIHTSITYAHDYVDTKKAHNSYVSLAKKGLLSSLTISIKDLPKPADEQAEEENSKAAVVKTPLITRLVISKETDEEKPQFEFRGIGSQNLIIKDNNGTLEVFIPLGKLDCPYTLADNVYLQMSLYLHVLCLTGTALLLPLSLLALTRHAPCAAHAPRAPSPAALAVTAVLTALAGLVCAFSWSRATLGGFDKLWTFPAFLATLVHGLAAAAVVLVAAVASGRRAEEADLTQSSCHYTSSGLSGMYDVTGSGAFPVLTPTSPAHTATPTLKESTAYFPSFGPVVAGTPKSGGRRASEATPLLLNGSFY